MEIVIKKNSQLIKVNNEKTNVLTKEFLEKLEREINGIEEIEILEGLEKIDSCAFCVCDNLKKVKLPNSLEVIDRGAFAYCYNIEEFELSDGIKEIGYGAFSDCENLRKITFSKNLKKIDSYAFRGCENLEKINFSDGVEVIGEYAFCSCENIKNIEIPKSVKQIGKFAFSECNSVEEIKFLGKIGVINSYAFCDCENLKIVKFCEGAKKVETAAFSGCENLEKIEINGEIEDIGLWVFNGCENITEIKVNNPNNLIEIIANFGVDENIIERFNRFYINNGTKELICSAEKIDVSNEYRELDNEKAIELKDKYSYDNKIQGVLVLSCVDNDKVDKIGNIGYILPNILENCDIKTFENKDNKIIYNNDKFNNLLKQIRKITKCEFVDKKMEYVDIFYLADTLGAFSDEEKERQIGCEFIATAFQQGNFNMRMIHSSFDSFMPIDYSEEIKKEWIRFLLNKDNFKKLIKIENEQNGYIARVYKLFDSIREFGRKSNGSQNYRQVNVKKRDEDIKEVLFKYIDLRNQECFDDAVDIRDEYLRLKEEGKLFEHILGEELKEENVFDKIQKEKENILYDIKDTLKSLDNVSENKFTYEFLSKYDAMNFALGKYCSCCAHLEGAGYGIMKASILHPNCQNLVIRDDNGQIVAKSTLYINTEQGYGVFNNVEVEQNIAMFEDEKLHAIYLKYMEAVDAFAKRYNEINKEKPIRQINVGMNLNDLEEQLFMYNKVSNEILEGLDFSKYGKGKRNYAGDWHKEQCVVWSLKSKEEKINKK